MNQIVILPKEIYSIILSYTNQRDILEFCLIKEFGSICKDNNFWHLLFTSTFPEYSKPATRIYDYRNIYFGLYEYLDIDHFYDYEGFFREYLETFKYLLETNQLERMSYSNIIQGLILIDDVDLFKKYTPDEYQDLKYLDGLFSRLISNRKLKPNIFDYLYMTLGKEYSLRDLSEILPSLINTKLINHIINKMPLDVDNKELNQFFLDLLESRTESGNLRVIWNKYRHKFNERQIYELNMATYDHFDETGDEVIINIFGEPKVGFENEDENE